MTEPVILDKAGAGYIGRHSVRFLQLAGYIPLVLDNLLYCHKPIVDKVLKVPLVGCSGVPVVQGTHSLT